MAGAPRRRGRRRRRPRVRPITTWTPQRDLRAPAGRASANVSVSVELDAKDPWILVEPAAIAEVCALSARRSGAALRLPVEPVRRRLQGRRARSRSSTISSRTRTATASCSRCARRATTRCVPTRRERVEGGRTGRSARSSICSASSSRATPTCAACSCRRTGSGYPLRKDFVEPRGVPRHLARRGRACSKALRRTHEPRRIRGRGAAPGDGGGLVTEEMTLNMGPQHPSHARRAALRRQGRRRGHARGDPRRRLPAPLDREDRREGRLARLHAVHRPRRLRRRDVLQPGLGDGVREARRHRGAEARRVLPRHRRRAQPHRQPPARRSARWRWTSARSRRSRTPSASARSINDLLEELCGARLTFNYMRIGGVAWDLPPGCAEKVLALPRPLRADASTSTTG